jgi:hypothetical protein
VRLERGQGKLLVEGVPFPVFSSSRSNAVG